MPTIEVTDDQYDRLESLREEMEQAQAGPYATVGLRATVDYLLDLAETVDDPARDLELNSDNEATPPADFSRSQFEEQLRDRNRQHSDPESADSMDLYSIAAEYDITGRSEMTKDELVEAILDRVEKLQKNPFALVDIELSETKDQSTTDTVSQSEPTEDTTTDDPATDNQTGGSGDGGQKLEAMMNLLETHGDKWTETDGDARYEVELPDGETESARTKDDVRALLFKHY